VTSRRIAAIRPPARPDQWEGVELSRLAEFLLGYADKPQPEALPQVVAGITTLKLLHRADHRYGIAGSLAAIFDIHPDLQDQWRDQWPEVWQAIESMRPSDINAEVRRPAELDYLWMRGLVGRDEADLHRVVGLGLQAGDVGDAAVMLIHTYAAHPLVAKVLAAAIATTTTAPRDDIPRLSIQSLARLVAQDTLLAQTVMLVGWKPHAGNEKGALIVVTPTGILPPAIPQEWDGHRVKARTPTLQEMERWRAIQADQDRP
jgi:hypothetical protein